MAFGIDPSDLATDSDVALFRSAALAIQRSVGRDQAIRLLPAGTQVVLRLYAFVALFGNGGLQYWFETDDPDLHPSTVDALGQVGLENSSSALSQAYAVFASRKAWDVYDERMGLLEELRSEFDRLEDCIWPDYDRMEAAGGQFVRSRIGDRKP